VSWGLQHLSSLSGLRELTLDECSSVSDVHIQALSTLSALTALDIRDLQITGASLSALAGLRTFTQYTCSNMAAAGLASIAQLQQLQQLSLDAHSSGARRAGQLAPLSQLTNLEELHVPYDCIEGPALALLDLPRLTSLEAWRISPERYESGRGTAILSLELRSTHGTPLDQLLPLPSLERLSIHRAYGDLSAVIKQPQLTYLGLGGLERSGGGGLVGALPELRHLQVLHLTRVGDCLTLEDMLALAQLQQLEELYIGGSVAPVEQYCLLQRCARLRQVGLQLDGSMDLSAMMSLVSKPGMQQVELGGVEAVGEDEERLQRMARRLGVRLTVQDRIGCNFWNSVDEYDCYTGYSSDEDGWHEGEEEGELDGPQDGPQEGEEGGEEEGEMDDG
jgi:hypothetical protein